MTDGNGSAKLGAKSGVSEIHILWISEGMSCDGDTVSITAASQPSIEEVVLGLIPGIPKVILHNKVLAYETGEDFLRAFRAAARGELGAPFILVIEGSIPNEKINGDGFWTGFGNDEEGQPITINQWIDALAPRAWAVVAAGTCATYGGIHAMAGNPTGCMGLADYLGWDFRTTETKLPIVNIPGCPVQPDNFMETLLWVLRQAAGTAPLIPLDQNLRPTWLFGKTVHEGCDRAGYYEQADFAHDYNSPKCQVKIGCWGPVVNCNVPKRGWMSGIGGCPNVGGICIGCTMPGFPDKFMPFMDQAPGSTLSSTLISPYGAIIRALRGISNRTANRETKWRHNRPALSTGYQEKHR
jgi:hydrogenase small subunit